MSAHSRPRLYLNEWPPEDRLTWKKAFKCDPLGALGGGGAIRWRPATVASVEKAYGYWLGWLRDQNEPDKRIAFPAARADRETVGRYLSHLEASGLSDFTRAGYLQGMSDALRVMCPDSDVSFIRRVADRIRSSAVRRRDVRTRIRPPQDLLEVGLELMVRAQREGPSELRRALLFRDGLLLALWVFRALRVSNLTNIALDRQLVKTKRGYTLQFADSEMKNRRSFNVEWPRGLDGPLDTYLNVYRPILQARNKGGASDGLWLSWHGNALCAGRVSEIINDRTRAALGEAVNPHFVRYIVGTAVAERQPHYVADVAAILSHACLETSERHYIHANAIRAAETYQGLLLGGLTSRRRDTSHSS